MRLLLCVASTECLGSRSFEDGEEGRAEPNVAPMLARKGCASCLKFVIVNNRSEVLAIGHSSDRNWQPCD